MYLEYFNLKTNPFSLSSEPQMLYYGESQCEAMAHLLYGIRERKGIILMLGEAGTGKTTLIRAAIGMLRSTRVVTSVILNPILADPSELLAAVIEGFGLEGSGRGTAHMAALLSRFVERQVPRERIPVLIVDEAQDLSPDMLEQIRMLSNMEHRGERSLQIVLAGQPELADVLSGHSMRALRQRITVRCRVDQLSATDTWNYIAARLFGAGLGDGEMMFTPDAVERIYAYSGGIPRVINMVCDNCLLAAFSRATREIQGPMVDAVCRHLDLPLSSNADFGAREVLHDIIRGSRSWSVLRTELQRGNVPEVLRKFVGNLRVPEGQFSMSTSAAAQRGS